MTAKPKRPRPTAYLAVGGLRSRPIILSSGRGTTKVTAAEAVSLAVELLVVAGRLDPAAAAGVHPLILSLAERCHAQSELLTACSIRKE